MMGKADLNNLTRRSLISSLVPQLARAQILGFCLHHFAWVEPHAWGTCISRGHNWGSEDTGCSRANPNTAQPGTLQGNISTGKSDCEFPPGWLMPQIPPSFPPSLLPLCSGRAASPVTLLQAHQLFFFPKASRGFASRSDADTVGRAHFFHGHSVSREIPRRPLT